MFVLGHKNFTSNTTQPPLVSHRIAGGVLLLMSISGFLVYLLFIVVVFKRQKFKNSPFFIIAAWLGIADCMSLAINITYAAPCVLLNENYSKSVVAGGMLNIAWFTSLPLILLLAINRYLCICRTQLCRKVYTRTSSTYYCFGCWCFGIGYSIASFFNCCPLYFEHNIMTWRWDVEKAGSIILGYVELTMVVIVTLGAFTLNAFVIR